MNQQEFELCVFFRFVANNEQEKDFDFHYPKAETLEQAVKIVLSEYGTRKRVYMITYGGVEVDKNLIYNNSK